MMTHVNSYELVNLYQDLLIPDTFLHFFWYQGIIYLYYEENMAQFSVLIFLSISRLDWAKLYPNIEP